MMDISSANSNPATILVVEDNKMIARELFILLSRAGYHVITENNGPDALETAKISKPDIVLLDVMMPDMNGFEVCQHLREDSATCDLPVIFMTALDDPESKVRGFELGAIDYVTKPVHNAELQARLTTHLTLINLRKGLQREVQEREKLIVELDAYAHTVAHDLKGTMNNVIGFAHMLVKNGDALSYETRNQALETIMQHSYKMRDIIDGLLLLANVRQEDIETEDVDMAVLIKETQERLSMEIGATHAVITVPEVWLTAVGYAPWIEEVWFNYLSNAIKYGGTPPQIWVGAEEAEEGFNRYWVRDNGSGVLPGDRKKIFQPFTRIHRNDVQGHGLGLSIVQRIVEKLGGQVGIVGEPGEGATFSSLCLLHRSFALLFIGEKTMAKIGRFMGGVGALIWYPPDDAYLLLRRAASKDYAGGVWECVTGRVDQGEGFIEALHREVREEIGIDVQIAYFLGTTHFYRGTAVPENELIGVVFVCVADEPDKIRLSAEHDAYQWVTADTVQTILSATDPSTQWALRVIARAAALRQHVTPDLLAYQQKPDFELG